MPKEEKVASNVVTSENLAEFVSKKLNLEQSKVEPKIETENKEEKKQVKLEEPEILDPEEPEDEETKKKNKLNERFSKITKQRKDAEQAATDAKEEVERLRKEIEELKGKTESKQENKNIRPDPKNFTDAFEYAEKLSEWSVKNAIEKKEADEAEKLQKEMEKKRIDAWQARQNAFKTEAEDYNEVLASSSAQVSDQIRDAILDSDIGPQLLYFLAQNDELVDKINSLSPIAAMRELGRLEAKLEKTADKLPESELKPKVEVSKAPRPISPVKSGGSALDTQTPDEIADFKTYRELRKAGKIK